MSTTEITVPALGESVVEATVREWLKNEGEPVVAGDIVVRLETDKVDLEVSAERAGVLAQIVKGPGEDVKVGDVLGLVADAGEGAGELLADVVHHGLEVLRVVDELVGELAELALGLGASDEHRE